jgi:hypothetical protein
MGNIDPAGARNGRRRDSTAGRCACNEPDRTNGCLTLLSVSTLSLRLDLTRPNSGQIRAN